VSGLRARLAAARDARGQGIVEMTLIVPVLMLLLTGMLELGLAYNDVITIGYASREGARAGAALGNGGALTCTNPDPAGVDKTIVASVSRILSSPGADIALADVREIRIYRAGANGTQIGGAANVWRYAPGAGPDVDPGPGAARLDFAETSRGWNACARLDGATPDSVGVRIEYVYRLTTPLAALMGMFGGEQATTLTLREQTVMAINPSA